jgi:hypothetical protein
MQAVFMQYQQARRGYRPIVNVFVIWIIALMIDAEIVRMLSVDFVEMNRVVD